MVWLARARAPHRRGRKSRPSCPRNSCGWPYPVADSRRRPREAEPANMAVDEVPANPVASRVYCPVVGCPCADPAKAAGWGEVPAAWLQAQGRQRCRVCGMSVSCRHGVHPTCRPADRAGAGGAGPRPADPQLPTFMETKLGCARCCAPPLGPGAVASSCCCSTVQ